MQLLPILLVLPLLLADGMVLPGGPPEPDARTPLLAIVVPLILVLAAWIAVRLLLRQLDRTRRGVWLARADRVLSLTRLAILAAGGWSILADGWLAWLRARTGDLVLVDELLAVAPMVAGLAGTWAVQHALEVRVRDAIRLRRLDEGRPIWPTPGRGRFVLGQVRLQLGLLGVPILAVLGLAELARWAVGAAGDGLPPWTADAASLVAAAIVFTLAPLAMRLVLPIAPMPPGTVRDDLVAMCRRLGVRVGDVMLWRTDGTLVNAAVVGVLPSVRYVLLTDAMIEQVPRPALRAVIAHELAHVHHRHVPWLVATLAGMLTLAGAAAAAPATALVAGGHSPTGAVVGWTVGGAGIAALVAVGVAFGWVSRRYERQADAFAVQAMSREPHWALPGGPESPASLAVPAAGAVRPPAFLTVGDLRVDAAPPAGDRIRPEAVLAMNAALGATAALNGVDPRRRSWRHGSIAWRQRYLADLVGRPVDGLGIDRLMRRLKIGASLVLLAGLAATAAVDAWDDAVHESRPGPAARPPASPVSPLLELPIARPPEADGAGAGRDRRAGTEDDA